MKPEAILASDSASANKTAGRLFEVALGKYPSGMQQMGHYHIQNVNALYSRIKEVLSPFHGVAAKNLPLYLTCFRIIDHNEGAAKPR